MKFLNSLKYFVLLLSSILLPFWVILRIIRVLEKKIKRLRYKCCTGICKAKEAVINNLSGQISLKKHWIRATYRIDKIVVTDLFMSINFVIFMFFMIAQNIAEQWLKEFVNGSVILRYGILIGILWCFTYWSWHCRNSNKETNRVWATTLITLLNIFAFSLTWVVFLSIVLNTLNFAIVVIAILFLFLPLYYIAMSMLDIIENPLLRILIGYMYAILVVVYTVFAIGIYNMNVVGTTVDLNNLGSILKMLSEGIANMSQASLKDIDITTREARIDRIIQILMGGYGGLVIAHVSKVASGPK